MTLRSITLPAPLPFPRTGYGDVLAEHARVLDARTPDLLALARKRLGTGEDLGYVDHYVGAILGPDAREPRCDLLHRASGVRIWRTHRGIAAHLLEIPPPMVLDVVVVSGCAVSLHTMRLAEESLTPEKRALVVEPRTQRHRVSGLAPLLTTRWIEPSGEARYGWVSVPPEPATVAEALDRLIARHEPTVRRKLKEYLAQGPTEPAAVVRSDNLGDSVTVEARSLLFVLASSYRDCQAAAEKPPRPGLHPVIAEMSGHARLRWIDLDAPAITPADPAELVEPFDWPEELSDLQDEPESAHAAEDRAARWTDAVKGTGRRLSDAELWQELQLDACFSEIEQVLGAKSESALDAVIAAAGFDPAAERARGIGIREKVLEAVWQKRSRDEEAAETAAEKAGGLPRL